ncbi:GNAT family N-acetyltransferase [Aestuariivivens sediminis]|uniref:GNAT family N-acetyltransferase n=1 Tax=Aestuariivivens sediminis TaxID=2913557 RepID=UPI001F578F2A|nr:GNAT family N-acetyltransferase [Aestuariivivens sediminis]
MIRKGTYGDIDTVVSITKACAKHMIAQNILQWNDSYPSKQAFLKDVERHELFVLEAGNDLVGCITISTLMDDIYKPVSWLTANTHSIYIHRLAIHPRHQGKGYAQQLMEYAEHYAIKNNYASIRLDTFSKNPRNIKFYELRGYQRLEAIYFPKQSKFPFYCYELIL